MVLSLSRSRILSVLLPLTLWKLNSALPPVTPLLVVGNRFYFSGEQVLLLEGDFYPVEVVLWGGLRALGKAPTLYKDPKSEQVFFDEKGFGIRGPWGEGGCFVVDEKIRWKGPFTPRLCDGRYVLSVPWFVRFCLQVKIEKEWICSVRMRGMTRIQRVKERSKAKFEVRVLEAREAWYKSLYVTAWGVENDGLRGALDHLVFLMGLMEIQIIKGEEGLVRLNLLAWRDALVELKKRLRAMAQRGEPGGVWVRLSPSWRAWPRIVLGEKKARAARMGWEAWLDMVGLSEEIPMAVFPFPLLRKGVNGKGGGGLFKGAWNLFPLALKCWQRWRREVDIFAFSRSSAVRADETVRSCLGTGRTWEVGWVPWF